MSAKFSRRLLLPGNILPLALVMTTTFLLAGMTLGWIVLDSVRRSADTDAATVSYYAADGGIERQLYTLRKQSAALATAQALTGTFSNGSSWQAANATYLQVNSRIFGTTASTSLQFIDLFDPDNIGAAGGVGRVDWSWSAGADCLGTPPEIEMGYAQWLSGASVLPQNYVIVRGLNSAGMSTILDPAKGYRLRFHPKECTATNLTINTYDSGGNQVVVPGDITLGAVGTFKRSTQTITVQMPRQDVLSGVFTYAIFSECQLVKDPSSPSACP